MELTEETIVLPLGCLQGGYAGADPPKSHTQIYFCLIYVCLGTQIYLQMYAAVEVHDNVTFKGNAAGFSTFCQGGAVSPQSFRSFRFKFCPT